MTVGTEVSHFVCSLNLRDSPDAPDNGLPRLANTAVFWVTTPPELSLPASSGHKKNLLCSSETSVPSKHTIRCHTPDDHTINFPRCEKLKLRNNNFTFCWPCISIYQCNENQLDALFILSLFRQSTLHVSGLFIAHHQEVKGKAIPLQTWTGPEGSRRLRLPDFKTIGTWRWWGSQPYALAAFTPRKYSCYSFLLEAESTPEP